MNYENLVRRIRQDDRLFDTDATHKIHRVLRKAVDAKIRQQNARMTTAEREEADIRAILRANPHLTKLDLL